MPQRSSVLPNLAPGSHFATTTAKHCQHLPCATTATTTTAPTPTHPTAMTVPGAPASAPAAPASAPAMASTSVLSAHHAHHGPLPANTNAAAAAAAMPPPAIPKLFLCPLTHTVMVEPTASKCGHMFDRAAILKWIKGEYDPARSRALAHSCPVCFAPLDEAMLAPCYPLKAAIQEWAEQQQLQQQPQQSSTRPGGGGAVGGDASASGEGRNEKNGNAVLSLLRDKFRLGKRSKTAGAGAGAGAGNKLTTSSASMPDLRHPPRAGPAATAPDAHARDPKRSFFSSSRSSESLSAAPGAGGSTTPGHSHGDAVQFASAPGAYPASGTALTDPVLSHTMSATAPAHRTLVVTSHGGSAGPAGDSVLSADEAAAPLVPVWAHLVPLVPLHPMLTLNREKFVLGRHVSCHGRLNLSEMSSRHACLWRQRRDDGLWEVVIEDRSTNGTFVNGHTLGKGHRRVVGHGDEIAFGRKFTSRKAIPTVDAFLDWVFLGTALADEFPASVKCAKANVTTFDALVAIDDAALLAAGVDAEPVRQKIISAVANWKHEHRFPAYRLALIDPDRYAPVEPPPPPPALAAPVAPAHRAAAATTTTSPRRASAPYPVPGPRHASTAAANDVEAAMARMNVGGALDLVARLRMQFPRMDADAVAVIVQYERLMLSTSARRVAPDELERRCAAQLADLQARQLAARLAHPLAPLPQAVVAAATGMQLPPPTAQPAAGLPDSARAGPASHAPSPTAAAPPAIPPAAAALAMMQVLQQQMQLAQQHHHHQQQQQQQHQGVPTALRVPAAPATWTGAPPPQSPSAAPFPPAAMVAAMMQQQQQQQQQQHHQQQQYLQQQQQLAAQWQQRNYHHYDPADPPSDALPGLSASDIE